MGVDFEAKPLRKKRSARRPVLRFVTFLAPNLFRFYAFLADHLGKSLGCKARLVVGARYEQLCSSCDVAVVCGLPYVESTNLPNPPVEPLAAPVLRGDRYDERPIYFSDVVVQRGSGFRSFADLRGCTWAYNESHSQSGYGITRYHLARMGETHGYFGQMVEAGFHERALEMVCSGAADAAAIDSHVLAVALRDRPELRCELRIIDTLGPSTIQPVVAARRLPTPVKMKLRRSLLELEHDPRARPFLDQALVRRFVPVTDASYDDIRHMLNHAQMVDR
jgi:phosphonate transport system substrate-binding protein